MFNAGDKIKALNDCEGSFTEGNVYVVARTPSDYQGNVRVVSDDEGVENGWPAKNFELAKESEPEQAMRFNNSKCDLAYFLTFDGGVDMLLYNAEEGTHSRYLAVAHMLGEIYRSDTCDAQLLEDMLDEMFEDFCAVVDANWPEEMIKVCEFGAKKYARGNYLKGRSLHDTCNSILRHMLQESRGEEIDPESGCRHEGHIAWNLLYFRHCFVTKIGKDDRIRAEKVAA